MMDEKMNFYVKAAEPAEFERITELILALHHYQSMDNVPRVPTVQDIKNDLFYTDSSGKVRNNNNGTYVIVAVDASKLSLDDGSHVIGYCIYTQAYSILEGRNFFMNSFFIDQDYRRHGIGRMFMDFIKKHGETKKIYRIDIPFMNDNQIGQKFYSNYGAYDVNDEYKMALLDCTGLLSS